MNKNDDELNEINELILEKIKFIDFEEVKRSKSYIKEKDIERLNKFLNKEIDDFIFSLKNDLKYKIQVKLKEI